MCNSINLHIANKYGNGIFMLYDNVSNEDEAVSLFKDIV